MIVKRALVISPFLAFLALAAVFAWRVTDGKDRSVVPSALIGRAAPAETFPPLSDGPGVTADTFKGQISLANVFASWCAPCRVEHPVLMELAKDPRIQMVGLNYKDRVPAARGFLAELGNPYDVIGTDVDGRRAIEWGVYGVPETFLVGPDGIIRAKHVGELNAAALSGSFGAALSALLAEVAPAS